MATTTDRLKPTVAQVALKSGKSRPVIAGASKTLSTTNHTLSQSLLESGLSYVSTTCPPINTAVTVPFHTCASICVPFATAFHVSRSTPVLLGRRYPPYDEAADPAEARLAIIRLHAEGWRVGSIAGYLAVSRKTVWRTLRRWVDEGVRGLDDKPHTRQRVALKTTLRAVATVKRLQQNPELGAWRIHAALKRLGIVLSPRTCGRILALNRRLYGLSGPQERLHEKKALPFAATRRHQVWAVDVRYLEDGTIHHLGGGNVYVLSVLDCYSRAILARALAHAGSDRLSHGPVRRNPPAWQSRAVD